MKSIRPKTAARIAAAVALALAATAITAPVGVPMTSLLLFDQQISSLGALIQTFMENGPLDGWKTFMAEASTYDSFTSSALAWTAIVSLVVTIAAAYLWLESREQRSDGGALGDASLIDSAWGRSRRNVCWDGRGKAPGPSLVYGFERGRMIGDPAFAHGWVNAKSGAGKSRSIGYASLYWNVKAGASVVYTARKLTDYKLCSQAIEKDGVKTFLLDLEKPQRGARFNLMDAVNACAAAGDTAGAQRASRQLAADLIKHNDRNPYFSNAARALLTAVILIVSLSDEAKPEEKNLVSVCDIIRRGMTGEGKDPATPLKNYIRKLGTNHPAYKAAAEFLQDNGTTAGRNVVSTLMTGITVIGDEGIEWMLSGNDFTLQQLATEQCVLFPHCLGEDDPYNVILAAMYNQLWAALQDVASRNGEKLPHPFVILGDEWGNLPRVSCLGEMVSLGRSMDLHVFVFVQNMAQLNKYNDPGDGGAGVDKLLGSMNLQIAMSVMKAHPDGEYFSRLCGMRTVRALTSGTSSQGFGFGPTTSSSSLSERPVELLAPSSFKDRVPLRDGIVVVKGGENGAPSHEGVFNMPIADATKISAVKEYFELGTPGQDRKRCEEMDATLNLKAWRHDGYVPRWCPIQYGQPSGKKSFIEEIEGDEWCAWDDGF